MTTPLWTATEAATATNGHTTWDWQANSVCIDSRAAKAGALFVAIVGDRVDGHAYVAEALAAGAAAAMVSQPVDGVDPKKLLVVEDTFTALEALGTFARARSSARIIGITGSVGKTTTKECCKLMCQAFGETYATSGNLNNHYGTPLSLANLAKTAKFGIFEMGMNHAGEIAKLAKMVRPHVAIITTVEAVHLEFFENERGIAKAKAEIFEGLEPGGIAVLNADNRHTDYIQTLIHPANVKHLTFGKQHTANLQLTSSAPTTGGVLLNIAAQGEQLKIELASAGIAMETAVLASLSAAAALELDLRQAAQALATFGGVKGRGQVEKVELDGKAMWWIDDSYNASPASMRAAFATLAATKKQKNALRSVAVLGDMLELGAQSAELHAGLAADIMDAQIDTIHTTGPLMQHLHQALSGKTQAQHHTTLAEMQAALKDQLQAGDVVLFKGSNGSNIHRLVAGLQT